MKARIWTIACVVMIVSVLFLSGQNAQAGVEPVLAVDNVFAALNSGEVDVAVSYFAEDATIENQVRGETYIGSNEIRQMLQEMPRESRHYDIVGVEMYGDTITIKVEISDHDIVWGTETISAHVKGGELQTFDVTAFRLELW